VSSHVKLDLISTDHSYLDTITLIKLCSLLISFIKYPNTSNLSESSELLCIPRCRDFVIEAGKNTEVESA